jgi:hypothetical protein
MSYFFYRQNPELSPKSVSLGSPEVIELRLKQKARFLEAIFSTGLDP